MILRIVPPFASLFTLAECFNSNDNLILPSLAHADPDEIPGIDNAGFHSLIVIPLSEVSLPLTSDPVLPIWTGSTLPDYLTSMTR